MTSANQRVDQRTLGGASDRVQNDYLFGGFRLSVSARVLLLHDERVRIGSRSFDLLVALVQRAGEIVSTAELQSSVWPNLNVDQANVRVQVVGLRKVLASDPASKRSIDTVPLRGYCFILPVTRGAAIANDQVPLARQQTAEPQHNLPILFVTPVGREAEIALITESLSKQRLVTIVGPGGVGKTTVALAVAHSLTSRFADGVCFVDLSSTAEQSLTTVSIAAALSIGSFSQDPVAAIIAHLQDKQMLLLMDTCEHVLDALAEFAERVLSRVADVRILATSRESLRATGERVHRLPSLSVPPPGETLGMAASRDYSAINLFVERARDAGQFELNERNLPLVVDICSRLDGIPLAIEFAAAQVPELGLQEISARLNDRFSMLTKGRRTALPRHRTLAATLDWSYGLLSAGEQAALRAASVFPGAFSHDAVAAVLGQENGSSVINALSHLFAKSILSADLSTGRALYRLLDTTRAYARAKASEQGELPEIHRAHARYIARVFEKADVEAEQKSPENWLTTYGQYLADVRAALDWAMGPGGDPLAGADLTASSVPLWTHLSLLNELRRRIETALQQTELNSAGDGVREMKLLAALSNAAMNLFGPTEQTLEICRSALEIADRMGNPGYQVRALLALWNGCFSNGDLEASLGLAERFEAAAQALGRADVLVGYRLIGVSRFYLGDVAEGRRHLETVVSEYGSTQHQAHMARFVFGQHASAKGLLASMLCFQGLHERAMMLTRETVDDILRDNHALTICGVLGTTCIANAIYTGHIEEAESYAAILRDTARRHDLQRWEVVAWGYEGLLLSKRGDIEGGVRELFRAVQRADNKANIRYMIILCEYCQALGTLGDITGGIKLVDDVIARLRETCELWYLPEFLRCRGNLLRAGNREPQEIRAAFVDSLQLSEQMGALTWRLHAAVDYGDFLASVGRVGEARELIQSAVSLFNQSGDTEPVRVARARLAKMTQQNEP